MKKLLTFLAAILCLTLSVAAQTRTVQGHVTSSEDGEPIIGANVVGAGTQIGVTTDVDGNFVIQLPESVKQLQLFSVGMVPKVVDIKPGKMNIEMDPEGKILDDVMVVAFGTAKKSAFTGAATVVKSEDLEKHITTNVANALVGSVPGFQMRGSSGAPGATQGSMNIRGISSMSASIDPLIIVDGSPYPASLSNIPQQDIESVTVLKDAASAALYGARGAAGVIIITTKSGKTKHATITVDAKWGSNSRAVQRYDVITDPGEFYEAYYAQCYNNNFFSKGMTAEAANKQSNTDMLNQLGYNVYTVPDGETLIGMNGRLNPNATLGRKHYITIDGAQSDQVYWMQPDDWQDIAYKNALRQEYNVNINGGVEKARYYFSMGYLKDDGIIDFSSFDRLTSRLKADFKPKDWFNFGVNVGYVHSNTKSTPNLDTSSGSTNMMYYTDYIAPIYPVYVRILDANGRPAILTDENGFQAYDYGTATKNVLPTQSYGVNRAFLATGNPLGANRYNTNKSIGNQLNSTVTAELIFTDFLKANVSSNAIWGETEYTYYDNPYYGPKAGVNGQITKGTTTSMRTNNTQTLTYFDSFGEHNIDVMFGHEYYRNESRYLSAIAQGGFSPEILEINAFAKKTDSGSYKTVYNVEGWFGRAQYNYADKYFASASFRRDASSRFAKDHRWGSFWSVGAAWIVNKDILKDVKWIDMLKLKASIGQQGNDNIGDWAYIDLYTLNQASDIAMSPSFYRIGNEKITWETTTNLNVGIEFGIFNNRLSGSIDFYNKKTSNLLFWLNVAESIGSRGYYDNIGDIRNTGIEVALNANIITTKLIDWSVYGNFAHNKDKILKLPASKKVNGGFKDSKNNIGYWYQEGKSLYNIFLPLYAGVNEQGQPLYYTDEKIDMGKTQLVPATQKTGVTTDGALAPSYELGTSLPWLFGGFGTSLRIQKLDISLMFDFQLGGKIYDHQYASYMTPAYQTSAAGQTYHKDYLKAWNPVNNTSSNIPMWTTDASISQYTGKQSDRFLTPSRYLNFQSFSVGYTLPKFWKEISQLRVYVMGENLCFWSARKGFDPRYSFSAASAYGGVSRYQLTRNISAGLQVTF